VLRKEVDGVSEERRTPSTSFILFGKREQVEKHTTKSSPAFFALTRGPHTLSGFPY